MNPKHLNVRVHPETGEFWIVEEKYRQLPRQLRNVNGEVLLCLGADLLSGEAKGKLVRDVKFPDGERIRVTVELVDADTDPPSPAIYHSEVNKDRNAKEESPSQ